MKKNYFFVNDLGFEIDPYDVCPLCNESYKRCPHMHMCFIS